MEQVQGFTKIKNRVRRLHALKALTSSLGCLLAIGLTGSISAGSGAAFLIPSFGATSVILFVIPASAYAQPRSLVGGHFLSSLVGFLVYLCLGTSWWSLALAVGIAVAAMQFSKTLHPPAAADPLFFMMQGGLSWAAVIVPALAGSLVLVLFAYMYTNWILKKRYPHYWL